MVLNIRTTHLLVEWCGSERKRGESGLGYGKDGAAAKTDGEECRQSRFTGEDQQFRCRHMKFGISPMSIRP